MLLRNNRTAIPRDFSSHPLMKGLVAEFDCRVNPRGTLYFKTLVFEHSKDLKYFWAKVLSKEIRGPDDVRGARVQGCVQGLHTQVEHFGTGKQYYDVIRTSIKADPRYFALMALVKTHLSAEIVTHECVHIGFAYAKRVIRSIFAPFGELDEELVAYPAGLAAQRVNDNLYKLGLYH